MYSFTLQAASERGRAAARKNQHPHRLGSGGYKSAERKWAADEKVYSSASSSGVSREDNERAFRFLAAHSKPDEEGKLVVCGSVDEVLQRVVMVFFFYLKRTFTRHTLY